MSHTALLRLVTWLYLIVVAWLLAAPLSFDTGPFSLMRFVWGANAGLRDMAENWLLGVPVGLVTGIEAIMSQRPLLPATKKTAALILIVVLPMEILQHWMPGRTASLLDVVMVLLGGLSGLLALSLVRAPIEKIAERLFTQGFGLPGVLMLAWPLQFWVPGRLQMGASPVRDGIVPLLHVDIGWPLLAGCLTATAGWLASAALLPRVPGSLSLSAIVAFAWAGLVLAPGRALSPTAIVGGLIAIILVAGLRRRQRILPAVIILATAGLLVGAFSADPAGPATFFWSPFGEFSGTRKLGILIRTVGENYALLALPVLLALGQLRDRAAWVASVIAISVAIMAVEALGFVAGRDGRLTPLLFLTVGAGLGWLQLSATSRRTPATGHGVRPSAGSGREKAAGKVGNRTPGGIQATASRPPGLAPVFSSAATYSASWIAFWTIVLAACFSGVLRLPLIPYNLREALGAHFSFAQLAFLAIAVIWIGMGGAVVARLVGGGGNAAWKLPLLTAGASLISFFLIDLAATGESIHDIVGSPTLWRDVITKGAWGSRVASFVPAIASHYVVDQLEYAVRYVALYSPIVLALASVNAGWTMPGPVDTAGRVRRSLTILAWALPWFLVCKIGVIDLAGTDNITELVEPDAFLGLGGEWLLFLLALLITFCGSLVAHWGRAGIRRLFGAVAIAALAAPVGWLLFRHGLVAHLHKYGLVFSGVDFLLGPNRRVLLPETQLWLRWAAVYMGAVLAIGLGVAGVPRRGR